MAGIELKIAKAAALCAILCLGAALLCSGEPAQRLRRASSYSDNSIPKGNVYKNDRSNQISKPSAKVEKGGFRWSAWGIIALLLTLILGVVFLYYFLLLYPILCRKERNYDVVGHSRDTTPTPNVSTNTEKLP